MAGAQKPENQSTLRQRIAERAKQSPQLGTAENGPGPLESGTQEDRSMVSARGRYLAWEYSRHMTQRFPLLWVPVLSRVPGM
jgi:hypothetical protein